MTGRADSRLRGRQKEEETATRGDLKRLKKDLDNNLRRQAEPSGTQVVGKAMRMARRGFEDIGRSLSSPYDTRRPKISQLPMRRRDIGIVHEVDLDFLKDPSLRGKDLRGRKLKGGK